MERTTAGYTHDPAFVADLTVLIRVGNVMRLGPGLTYTPKMVLDTDTAEDVELGTEYGVFAVGEPAIPIAAHTWIAVRAELGALFLVPSGETRRAIEGIKDLCYAKEVRSELECASIGGPSPGLAAGFGSGGILEVGNQARLRADLLLRYYWLDMTSLGNGSYGDAMLWTMSGLRASLLFGADLL